jgi:sugar phosphate isomerase/epimerase
VRLGVSPIGWSNDDLPEQGGDIPLDRCLAEAGAAGYGGIELGHKFPRDPTVLKPLLDRFGLALISGWFSGRLLERSVRAEIAAIEPHSSLLVAMGCRVLVYAETSGSIAVDRRRPLSARPRLGASDWHDFGARLTEPARRLLGHFGRGSAIATGANPQGESGHILQQVKPQEARRQSHRQGRLRPIRVRNGLAAGGERIRTFSSAMRSHRDSAAVV